MLPKNGGFFSFLSEIWDDEGSDLSDLDEGYESEISVSDDIKLGVFLDRAIGLARLYFGRLLSLHLAWLYLCGSVKSFRTKKMKQIDVGVAQVLAVQKALRSPFLDIYFSLTAFFAEEEFYLITLPILFWNIDYEFGKHMNYIVCFGLFVGNTIKDVFELPRPASPPVWRPKHQESIDSTMMKDFGFPSTHTMNAVSNSLFTYYYLAVTASAVTGVSSHTICIAATLLWILSLTVGRLYLGAHSVVDIVGGFWLGLVVVAVYVYCESGISAFVATTPLLGLKCLIAGIVALLLLPQPRPPTPTFMQNALLVGLITGAAVGQRFRLEAGIAGTNAQEPIFEWSANAMRQYPSSVAILRTVIGYAFVLSVRFVLKPTLRALLGVIGVYKKPSVVIKTRKGGKKDSAAPKSARRNRRGRVVMLLTRGVDIVGGAIIKCLTYFAMAFSITFAVPFMFHSLGIASTSA